MRNFTFHNPTKLIFGKGTISQIGPEIASIGFNKILFLGGGGSIKKNGVYQTVCQSLNKSRLQWSEVWGIQSNPALDKVEEAIKIAKEERVDCLLAVGGGSVIDTAKAAAAGFYLSPLWDAFEKKAKVDSALPIFVVLTISATGSEMNGTAVITNSKEKKKWSIASPLLYPVVSIVDPEVQNSLSWPQTVSGAIDSMAHILEFYITGSIEEPTLSLDESLLRSIVKATDRLQANSTDYQARATLAWSSTLALNGISQSGLGGDWFIHGLEHTLSALHPDVPHGAGLGVLFPAWIRYLIPLSLPILPRFAEEVWGKKNAEEAVQEMISTFSRWGAPTSLRELGFKKEDIMEILENFLLSKRRSPLK